METTKLVKHRGKRQQPTIKDPYRICIVCKYQYKAVSYMQKTCCEVCRKQLQAANTKTFKDKHPNAMRQYNKNREAKNPTVWKDKVANERSKIIDALGGKCCVENCNVENKNWLHVDYIPTMIGTGFRHPRHFKWVMDNLSDFRLLCANHHYELTITGRIQGSTITQQTFRDKSS